MTAGRSAHRPADRLVPPYRLTGESRADLRPCSGGGGGGEAVPTHRRARYVRAAAFRQQAAKHLLTTVSLHGGMVRQTLSLMERVVGAMDRVGKWTPSGRVRRQRMALQCPVLTAQSLN